MRKIIIISILMTATILTAKAQFFVEGYIGVNYTNTEAPTGVSHIRSTSSFGISPQIGYWLNDNIAVGVVADVGRSIDKYVTTDHQERETVRQTWGFSVFGRYKLWGTEKFSVLIETPARIGRVTQKEETDAITTLDYSNSVISIRAYPLISYALTEKFSIITGCNFLSLGFYSYNGRYEGSYKTTTNRFVFDAQSSVFNSLSNISIGFTYNF